jgi:hypothetical protein
LTTLITPAAPTSVPGGVNTIIAQTAEAAATQTALLAPSPTQTPTPAPLPTNTPTVTPSASPTFVFILPTFTHTSTPVPASDGLACTLTAQDPPNDATLPGNQAFSTSWTVTNSGSTVWDVNSVDFVYVSGAKLAKAKAADLPKSVGPGDSITLKLSMTAPGAADTYKTVWTLQSGKNAFCRLTVSIKVK